MRRVKQTQLALALLIGLILAVPAPVFADESSSSNYKVDQTFFGSGGDLENSSANYKAKTTVGELGVGNFSSANYQAFAGFNTTSDPYLEFVVVANNIDLGYLSTSQASTAIGTFSVRAWQSSGYIVQTASDPPTNVGPGAHQLAAMAGGGSSPGTEQFGINLKTNTSPSISGSSDPQQSNAYAYGTAAAGYNVANVFKYNKGDIIAQSTQSTSITNYTVSYLFNISNLTPAGEYHFVHTMVATATY